MRIECPGCDSVYQVPDAVYVPGRTVRCAKCGHDWKPAGDVPASCIAGTTAGKLAGPHLSPAESADEPESAAERATQAVAAEPRRRAVLAAWAASLVALGAAGSSAIAWRQPVMKAWPPSARLFSALRLE